MGSSPAEGIGSTRQTTDNRQEIGMLTVKLVEPNGQEQLWEAEHVWVEPTGKGNHKVRFTWHSASVGEITSGIGTNGNVYVMNSQGKTVARYTLADPDPFWDGTGEDTREKK